MRSLWWGWMVELRSVISRERDRRLLRCLLLLMPDALFGFRESKECRDDGNLLKRARGGVTPHRLVEPNHGIILNIGANI